MPAYLITWNPVIWPWEEYNALAEAVREGRDLDDRWSTGRTLRVQPGDRLWLMRLGKQPKGIIGAAAATSAAFRAEHWADPTKVTCYVDLRWEILLKFSGSEGQADRGSARRSGVDPAVEPILGLAELQDQFPGVRWTPQGSGMSIPEAVEPRLELLWAERVSRML